MVTVCSRPVIKSPVGSQVAGCGSGEAHNLNHKESAVNETRLDLLDKICKNARSVKEDLPVISSITEMARYALNASASSLLLLDGENNGILYQYIDGPLGRQFKRMPVDKQPSIAGCVIQNGRPLIIKDVTKDEGFNKFKDDVAGLVTRSVICAPLVINGAVTGAIEAINKLEGNEFNEHDLLTLVRLATYAALTIENINWYHLLTPVKPRKVSTRGGYQNTLSSEPPCFHFQRRRDKPSNMVPFSTISVSLAFRPG
jgi:hypothetical protein